MSADDRKKYDIAPKLPERGSTHVYKVNRITKEEIDEMTGLCTHDEPAFCNAACPLKVDAKDMLACAAKGDFKGALRIYEKAVPFPVLMSLGCDAPCEKKCRLCEVGDGVALRDIEASVSFYGERTKSGQVFRMKKKKTVAIFGSGLFCLFLAGELEKKMYPVTVFCGEDSAEEYLQTAADDSVIDAEAFSVELARLKSMDISFEFGCSLTPEFFAEKRADFDIVCTDLKTAEAVTGATEIKIDEVTAYCEKEKLVVGLSSDSGVLAAALEAKKAALTVDRLAQNLDPRNSRGAEGSVGSRLYTDLTAAKLLQRVQKSAEPTSRYTKEEAIAEAGRCIQCSCEECMKSCEFLKKAGKYPVLLAREIYNNTQIIMGDHPLNRFMNVCALCGQCKIVCPNGFDMARVCRNARANMVSTDKMSLGVHEFALLDLLFSNDEAFLALPQPGYESGCKYVFFPGCQAAAIAPDTVEAAYRDLCGRLDGGVALMLGCCGVIADWAGRDELLDSVREKLLNELEKLGKPQIIAGCPSCKKELEKFYKAESSTTGAEDITEGTDKDAVKCGNAKITGIWDILNEIGLPESASRRLPDCQNGDRDCPRYAVHDSCGARGDAETQRAIRTIAEKLGCEVVDTPYSGDASPCCGYGGLTQYTDRDLAGKMAEKCLERSDLPYITYCMACRDRFAREGRESAHILELVYGATACETPDISAKRYNRLGLKQKLLKEIWEVDTEMKSPEFAIEYATGAEELLADRMILKTDVEQVLEFVRDTGEMIQDIESGHMTACRRIGNATFWVVFDVTDGGYLVHRAYSHRMTVEKREG